MKALLELYLEDLPPSEFPDLLVQMREKMGDILEKHTLSYSNIETTMTIRRLVISIDGLPKAQPSRREEIKGPPERVAFSDGKPTKALEGFLRKYDSSLEDIKIEKGYVFLIKEIRGKDLIEVMKDVFVEFIQSLEFKKPMRWGNGEYEFVRPVHSILAMVEGEVVEFEIFGLKSGNTTRGLRFHSGDVQVKNVGGYKGVLRRNLVVVDLNERRDMVREQLRSLDLEVDMDEDLIDEVVYLTEYPRAVVGEFDTGYLTLPEEIIVTTVKHHERTFATFKDGRITNVFVGFQDGPDDPEGNVKRGFERVINARLEDARYYYEKDLEIPLENWNEHLKGVVFQKKLGTLYDKVLRVKDLSIHIAKSVGFKDLRKVERAAFLSKADIVTKVVYEFPELQGVMGRIYALAHGEDEEIAWAIEEQYSSDPGGILGAIVGMADRLDTIVGNFAIGNVPSGSKDPYGLRRKADDVYSIVRKFEWDVDLVEFIDLAKDLIGLEFDPSDLLDFMRSRFRAFLIGRGMEQDVAKAVEHLWSRPLRGSLAAEALNELIETPEIVALRVGFERIHNMVRNHESLEYDGALLKEPAEIDLVNEFFEVKKEVLEALDSLDYKRALKSLTLLKPHIDRYFDEVFVMVNREDLRRNRLGFLKNLDDLFLKVADLTQISKERVLGEEEKR